MQHNPVRNDKSWVAFDTETALIGPGEQVPELTCLSYAGADNSSGLLGHQEALVWFEGFLEAVNSGVVLGVGHNLPYDLFVMNRESGWRLTDQIFEAYDKHQLADTLVISKLDDIADGIRWGRYSLDMLVKRYFGVKLDKNTWRLRYGELRGVPISKWEEGARQYALNDAKWTLALARSFQLPNNWEEQSKYMYGLQWLSARGMLTDLEYVGRLEKKFQTEMVDARNTLVREGLIRKEDEYLSVNTKTLREKVRDFCITENIEIPKTKKGDVSTPKSFFSRTENLNEELTMYRKHRGFQQERKMPTGKNGRMKWDVVEEDLTRDYSEKLLDLGLLKLNDAKFTRNSKAIQDRVAEAFQEKGMLVPYTLSGNVATDKDTIKTSGDRKLTLISDYMHSQKMLSTYVSSMKEGIVHTSFNPIVNSGRTSSRQPNLQNIPSGDGIREAFVPREGYYFCAVDYDTLELRTLAQTLLNLFGESKMAQALQEGHDLHSMMGARLSGFSVDDPRIKEPIAHDVSKTWRDFAKIVNFGLPGGMGAETFAGHAARNGIPLSISKAKEVIGLYREQWPAMGLFFQYVGDLLRKQNYVKLEPSGRVRGDVHYTDCCNNFFQGLAADGAKEAVWQVVKACYKTGGVLQGVKPVNFIHDEILAEVPIPTAHENAHKIAEIMCSAMQTFTPDIPITCEPVLMTRWSKKAKMLLDDKGRLIACEPELPV